MSTAQELHVFGDDSVAANIVLFGILVVPAGKVPIAEDAIGKLKQDYRAPQNARIHCRELFRMEARARSPWAHLSDADAHGLCRRAAEDMMSLGLTARIGFVNKAKTPDKLDAFGKTLWLNGRDRDKKLTVFAYMASLGELSRTIGVDRIRVFIDPDNTKIDWWGKRPQVKENLKFYTDFDASKMPTVQLKPEPVSTPKPVLLEIADVLAYSCAQALSNQYRTDKWFFQSIFDVFRPHKSEMFLGDDPAKNPYAPGPATTS